MSAMARLTIRVQPRASSNQIVGWEGEALKVRLTAPPVEGKANEALIEFLASRLGVAKRALAIVSGHGARTKIVELAGLTVEEATQLLGVEPTGRR
jgi:uncharacterized protein